MNLSFIFDFVGDNFKALIALSALGLAVWQGMAQRHHNRLSVKPHLTFTRVVTNISPQLVVRLTNNGTGPAIIKKFSILLDGKFVDTNQNHPWESVIKKINLPAIFGRVIPDEGQTGISAGGMTFDKGEAIQAGRTEEIFIVTATNEDKCETFNLNAAHGELDRIQIIIEFESVYKDHYIERFNKT